MNNISITELRDIEDFVCTRISVVDNFTAGQKAPYGEASVKCQLCGAIEVISISKELWRKAYDGYVIAPAKIPHRTILRHSYQYPDTPLVAPVASFDEFVGFVFDTASGLLCETVSALGWCLEKLPDESVMLVCPSCVDEETTPSWIKETRKRTAV